MDRQQDHITKRDPNPNRHREKGSLQTEILPSQVHSTKWNTTPNRHWKKNSLRSDIQLFRVHTQKGTLNPFDKQKRTDYGRRSSPLGSTPPKGTPLANLHMKKIQFTERVLALWGLYISMNKTQSHSNYTIIKQVPFEPHGIYSTKQTIKSH